MIVSMQMIDNPHKTKGTDLVRKKSSSPRQTNSSLRKLKRLSLLCKLRTLKAYAKARNIELGSTCEGKNERRAISMFEVTNGLKSFSKPGVLAPPPTNAIALTSPNPLD
ncbi:MAG: hypothetical protein BWZ03_00568 [bacterium ADurb.BinA186]|nr:MAG: hypothetical protein BWZ03_00568 [bacterium ADurb.BinA186]